MREDDGRKLDHQTLEAIRLRAVEQVARGVPAARAGAGLAALGLHRPTIYNWLATEGAGGGGVVAGWARPRGTNSPWGAPERTEGLRALRAKPVPGRARKLTDAQ